MKTILVTGANGNLGTEVVQHLNDKGHCILASVGRQKPTADFLKMTQETRQVNLTDELAAQQYVQEIIQASPQISAAVLLVGGFTAGGIKEADGSSIDKLISLNFKTAYFIVRPLLEHFEKNGGGQFIFIGGRPALKANIAQDYVAYALSKSMLLQLSEIINEAGIGKHISATVIAPSTIDTPINRTANPDADFSKWVKASDIAETISFVLSDAGKNLRESVLKTYNEA